jgi:hypothetical protein
VYLPFSVAVSAPCLGAPEDVQDAGVALARAVAGAVVAAEPVLEVDELEVVALTPALALGVRRVDEVVLGIDIGGAHGDRPLVTRPDGW